MNAQGPEMEEEVDEMDFPHDPNVAVIEILRETDDIVKSCSVSIPKKYAEDHLPHLAPGQSKMLQFEDFLGKNNFRMEFVHSNCGDYYLRTGWESYRDEHKLEYGDFISFYKKKENQNGVGDTYVIYGWKLPKKDEPEDVKLDATLQDPIEPIEIPVFVKNISVRDLYGNPKGLRLTKKEVEENLLDLPLPQVGGEIILPLHDPIGKKSFTVELVHAEQDEYYIGGRGWEEYVAEHKLLIFDTIFINKVILDPSAEVQLVNISYHYEITYMLRSQKKPKQLGKTMKNSSTPSTITTAAAAAAAAVNDSSAPASTATTTAVNDSSEPASTATATGNNSSAPDYTTMASTSDENNSKGYGLQKEY